MKLFNALKIRTTKVLAATALIAGALTVAAPAAQAQRVYFGFHAGPRYVEPVPAYRPYYGYGYGYHPYYWHHEYRRGYWR